MSNDDIELLEQAEKLARELVNKLKKRKAVLALAESCTGGLVSAMLSGVPGASLVLWGSFVCYTKEAKVSMLDLDSEKLTANGLVCGQTASSMASGALQKSGADIAAAVTGLAGPSGDGSNVPVGTVWIAAVSKTSGNILKEFHFADSRNEIRLKAVIAILETVMDLLT